MSIFMVRQMHDKFGFKRNEKPGFLEESIMTMRINFMLEELIEFAEACGYDMYIKGGKIVFEPAGFVKDLEKAFDGLLDMEVVNQGTGDLMGFGAHVPSDVTSRYATIWGEGEDRVHKANMAKVRMPKGIKGKRGTDHDLMKPEGWTPPQFKDLLR